MDFSTEFLAGMRDCKDGKAHEAGKGEAYDRGYATQYESEQVQAEMSKWTSAN